MVSEVNVFIADSDSINFTTIPTLLAIIPAFSSPASSWTSKIRLLWPTTTDAPGDLLAVLRLKLPVILFDKTQSESFADHLALLQRIEALEGPSQDEAISCLFKDSFAVPLGQLPSETFRSFLLLTQRAFHATLC